MIGVKPWQTIVVDPQNQAEIKDLRYLHEGERIDLVKSLGSVPEAVGPDIVEAPARGRVELFEDHKAYPKGEHDIEYKPAGFKGRKALRHADNFAVAAAHAKGRGRTSPFTPSHAAMGRYYRNLVERYETAGVKCSSLEGLSSGGTGGDFLDAVLRDRDRVLTLRRRIGTGAAMSVRRIRPSQRRHRVNISDRRLVDQFCIEELSLTEILRAHGWVREGEAPPSKHIKALQGALCDALERMMGPKTHRRTYVIHFDDGPVSLFNKK